MQKKFQAGTFMPDSMISCRTLYKANGFSDDDFSRPVIGVCDSFTDIVGPLGRPSEMIDTPIEELKKEGMWFVCADMSGEPMYRMDLTGPIGVVIGSEGDGVSRLI